MIGTNLNYATTQIGIGVAQFWDEWEVKRAEHLMDRGNNFLAASEHASVERQHRQAIEGKLGRSKANTSILTTKMNAKGYLACESTDPKIAEILAGVNGGEA